MDNPFEQFQSSNNEEQPYQSNSPSRTSKPRMRALAAGLALLLVGGFVGFGAANYFGSSSEQVSGEVADLPTPAPTVTVTVTESPSCDASVICSDSSSSVIDQEQGQEEDSGVVVGGNPSDGLDPRFTYCYEAVSNGYGDYVYGVDPEYEWYDDRDRDGVVCERS